MCELFSCAFSRSRSDHRKCRSMAAYDTAIVSNATRECANFNSNCGTIHDESFISTCADKLSSRKPDCSLNDNSSNCAVNRLSRVKRNLANAFKSLIFRLFASNNILRSVAGGACSFTNITVPRHTSKRSNRTPISALVLSGNNSVRKAKFGTPALSTRTQTCGATSSAVTKCNSR